MSASSTGNLGNLPNARLSRLETSEEGTFGRFTFYDFMCFSGELPWNDNQSNISCIPKGSYVCIWTYSPRFKRKMFEIKGVPARAGIRIHSANFMGDDRRGFKRQLNGCIALGEKLGAMDGQKALFISKPAIRRFETLTNGKPFLLEIK